MRNRLFVAAAAALVLVLPAVGLAAARGTVLSTKLRGSAEAAKGSPTGSGTATITLDTKKSKACWTLSVHGIGKPLSAHVHKGPVGKAGPVVIPLTKRDPGTVRLLPNEKLEIIVPETQAVGAWLPELERLIAEVMAR